jgi:hypothetical protein
MAEAWRGGTVVSGLSLSLQPLSSRQGNEVPKKTLIKTGRTVGSGSWNLSQALTLNLQVDSGSISSRVHKRELEKRPRWP